ncbi:alpha/beta hydrolase [Polaromonas sp.]|uniref:alpha/beta hydrolase family protein n=1 Tax=Polaromonas sp. TaxID=1869339 RepID=UPI0032666470
MRRSLGVAAGLLLACSPWMAAWAQQPACSDGKTADGVVRAGNNRHCLVVRKLTPGTAPERIAAKVLVVFLHGDNGGRTDLKADSGTAAMLAEKLQAVTIDMQSPGYRSDLGTSDGQAGANGDDYTARNVEIVAGALDSLRILNPGKKILLVGHSGAAAMAALVAGRFPGSADAYLLAGCPCDAPAWRKWRNVPAGRAGAPDSSLSPLTEVEKIGSAALISVVVGNKDENALPQFSETYVRALQARGVKTRVTYAMNATHVSVQRAPEFFMLAGELAGKLSK